MDALRTRSRLALLALLALMLVSALVVVAPRFSAAQANPSLTCENQGEDGEEGTGELPEEMNQIAPDPAVAATPLPDTPGIEFRWRRVWIEPKTLISAQTSDYRYVVIVTEGSLQSEICFKNPDGGWARVYQANGSILDLNDGDRFTLQVGDVAEFQATAFAFVTGSAPTYVITSGNSLAGDDPCPGTRCFTPPFIDWHGVSGLLGRGLVSLVR